MQIEKRIIIFLSGVAIISGCSDPAKIPLASGAVAVHSPVWLEPGSDDFHADKVAGPNSELEQCRQCHGADLSGGIAEASCAKCHAHPDGWLVAEAPEFHATVIAADNHDLSGCEKCHGAHFSDGIFPADCSRCHVHPAGPEACNTCHGNFPGNPDNLADVVPDKGAHEVHLEHFGDIENTCASCHAIPATVGAAGHLDNTPGAEVNIQGNARFAVLARTITNEGQNQPAPTFDHQTETCANTYCHGDWKLAKARSNSSWNYAADHIEGNAATPGWDDPASAACGTCHALPPVGHNPSEISGCAGCHGATIDDTGNIIDESKHINGKVNLFGQEYDMF